MIYFTVRFNARFTLTVRSLPNRTRRQCARRRSEVPRKPPLVCHQSEGLLRVDLRRTPSGLG